MNRIIAFVLTICICLGICAFPAVSAEDTPLQKDSKTSSEWGNNLLLGTSYTYTAYNTFSSGSDYDRALLTDGVYRGNGHSLWSGSSPVIGVTTELAGSYQENIIDFTISYNTTLNLVVIRNARKITQANLINRHTTLSGIEYSTDGVSFHPVSFDMYENIIEGSPLYEDTSSTPSVEYDQFYNIRAYLNTPITGATTLRVKVTTTRDDDSNAYIASFDEVEAYNIQQNTESSDNPYADAVFPASVLTENSENTAFITDNGEIHYWGFTPSVSGEYVIWSTEENIDTKVTLYDINGAVITSDDDGGSNTNFLLKHRLEAGTTYFYGIQYYSNINIGLIHFSFFRSYTIAYDANGGYGADQPNYKIHDEPATLSTMQPQREGFYFLGWATTPGAGSAAYDCGEEYYENADVTLYAIWIPSPTEIEANNSYTAELVAGGYVPCFIFSPQTDGDYVIYSTGSSDTFVALYNNKGEYISSDDDGGYQNNFRLQYTLQAGRAYFYCVAFCSDTATGTIDFNLCHVNTVEYDANGGSGAPESQTYDFGAELILSTATPTKDGYRFLGWSESPDASLPEYRAGDTFTANRSTVLYAVWVKEITLNSEICAEILAGGDECLFAFTPSVSGSYAVYSTGSDDTRVNLYDSSLVLITSDDDSGAGLNFSLQYQFEAGTTYIFGVHYYGTSKTGTINFNFGEVYTVSYETNGGYGAPASQTKYYGTDITIGSETPYKSGCTFLGWSENISATTPDYVAGDSFGENRNAVLHAVWINNSLVHGRNDYSLVTDNGTPNFNNDSVSDSENQLTDGHYRSYPDGRPAAGVTVELMGSSRTFYCTMPLGTEKSVSAVVFRSVAYNDRRGLGVISVEFSADGNTWRTVPINVQLLDITDETEGYYDVSASFNTVNAKYIRITFDSSNGDTRMAGIAIEEIEVWGDEPIEGFDPSVYPLSLMLGDVSGDGTVNSLDAAQVLRYDAQALQLDQSALAAADVNGDGLVNSLDAAMILRYDAGLITEF